MESRQLYKEKYEAQMREWSSKLDGMRAQTEKLTAQAKLDVKPHLDAVHLKIDAAKARLAEIAGATDQKWHDLVKDADLAWSDLKSAAEGALDAMKRHKTG
jgi:t-SNARE complex subunit (syntaxin)